MDMALNPPLDRYLLVKSTLGFPSEGILINSGCNFFLKRLTKVADILGATVGAFVSKRTLLIKKYGLHFKS